MRIYKSGFLEYVYKFLVILHNDQKFFSHIWVMLYCLATNIQNVAECERRKDPLRIDFFTIAMIIY